MTPGARVLAAHKCDKCGFYQVSSSLKALIFVPHQDSVDDLLGCSVAFLSKQSHFCYNWKLNNVLPEAGANPSSCDGPAPHFSVFPSFFSVDKAQLFV